MCVFLLDYRAALDPWGRRDVGGAGSGRCILPDHGAILAFGNAEMLDGVDLVVVPFFKTNEVYRNTSTQQINAFRNCICFCISTWSCIVVLCVLTSYTHTAHSMLVVFHNTTSVHLCFV